MAPSSNFDVSNKLTTEVRLDMITWV